MRPNDLVKMMRAASPYQNRLKTFINSLGKNGNRFSTDFVRIDFRSMVREIMVGIQPTVLLLKFCTCISILKYIPTIIFHYA